MIVQLGLVLISIGWIVQMVKMKKDNLDKYALSCYIIGAALLAINGFMDGAIADTDVLETLTLVTSGAVLIKLWKQNKKK